MSVFAGRRFIVDFFVIALGISSWIEINGLWTQTPILTTQLPEKWNLPSYVVLITQIANIGPILYGIFRRRLRPKEGTIIHLIIGVGTIASILLTFFWRETVFLWGKERSLVFLLLTLLLAMVDCTSSVAYLPYMANLKSKYLMSFFIGEGLSGFIPSMVSLFQGVGGNPRCVNVTTINGSIHSEAVYSEPRFSTTIFCLFLTTVMMFSWISYALLNSSFCDSERVTGKRIARKRRNENEELEQEEEERESESPILKNNLIKLTTGYFRYLLFIQAFICALTNGFLPSFQSYSAAPYGSLTYNLALKLSGLANPICSFIAFFYKKHISPTLINFIVLYGLFFTCYIMFAATSSPHPPLQDSCIGSLLMIVSWISFVGSFSYVKSCIASIFRDFAKQGHVALFWIGVFTQVGSACGALISFVLINFSDYFKSYNPCA